MTALFCLALIPMVGLAIDGTSAYMMRAQISTALDAAVLAGARSLGNSAVNATTVAQNVFNANISQMSWQMKNVAFSFAPGQTGFVSTSTATPALQLFTATASAQLPLSMMSLIGHPSVNISVTAQAQRRDLNVVLVFDQSGSMAAVLPTVQTDATAFVGLFASGRDHVGLVTFSGTAWVACQPTTAFMTGNGNCPGGIPSLLASTVSQGQTNLTEAIWFAYQQLVAVGNTGALNVIVVFTDGIATTFSADFSQLMSPSTAGCGILPVPTYGVLAAATTGGKVAGITDPTPTSLTDYTEGRSAPGLTGCTKVTYPQNKLVAKGGNLPGLLGLPTADRYGNSTNGGGSISEYTVVNMASTDNANVTAAAENTFDDAANKIRSTTLLTPAPTIYTIALGGNAGSAASVAGGIALLARVANDPSSASYNSGQPAGRLIVAPTVADLPAAFSQVASVALRLSQ